ncbi:unnamed protein product [Chironomus riparius]|uniref:non-specific serine/threonine protein kinase n=1 Tax=Chironomus riparius TaxID=315576 RepID=A0A9N9RWM3_9DIPT|nr:unnamed protein product [Chironomus riparius]
MSVLSVINQLNLENPKKCFIILPIIVFGLLYVKSIYAEDIVQSQHQYSNENDGKVEGLSYCDEHLIRNRESSKRLLLISTLDGGVTALDLTKNGEVVWNFITEPGDLLSSSIHRLEMSSQGKYVRLIPSLSGGIYKFDGDSIEAVPVRAEDLLRSSFKFSDDMVISGGKEVRTYGVNCRNGQIIYEQSMGVSKNFSETVDEKDSSKTTHDPLLDDILVVKRHTQTVRANEPRTGSERWNFSIGHHEMQVALSDNCRQQSTSPENQQLNDLILDTEIRVIVPEGILCAYSKKNPAHTLWKYKFDSPIVSVFRSNVENVLYSVDLFANTRWLWEEHSSDVFIKAFGESKLSPALYLGMFQHQLYIQESDMMKSSIEHFKYENLQNNIATSENRLPKIPFKPIPAANNALIDLVSKFKEKDENNKEHNYDQKQSHELIAIDDKMNAQLVLHGSHYGEGRGYYFFSEKDVNHSTQCSNGKAHKKIKTTNETPQDVDNITFQNLGMYPVRLSLWYYWKEIVVIALTTAFVVNFILRNQNKRGEREVVFVPIAKEAIDYDEEEEQLKKQQQEIEILRNEAQKMRSISESAASNEDNYSSRFLEDFDLMRCLGKGGFGVVFEVRNKLDDCNYAIKRILLPSKQESRERVLREVKTLANCEHKNIVRYFHAWVEQPPKGWQEAKDKEIFSRDICSTSITIDSPSPTEESKGFSVPTGSKMASHKFISNGIITKDSNSSYLMNLQNKSFLDFDDAKLPDDDITADDDDSCSFIQFKADTNDNSETKSNRLNLGDESFAIEFKELSQSITADIKPKSSPDTSHVISITDETSVSQSTRNDAAKPTHRRNLSLDLLSNTNVLPKKLNSAVGSPVKMYLFIQMQLCMKTCLKDWLKQNDLKVRNGETVEIWNQIIQAVHYVHLKGLIHRDLKPSNIFFALDGQVKIGDFGLVTDMAEQPMDPLTSSSSSNSNSLSSFDVDFTVIGHKKHTQRVGTSLYMSPEQAKGLAYNYKVDIYSLGLIFFELLNFFHTETERYKVLQNIKNQKYPDEFIENNKNEFELLKLMLSKKPEERPTTYGIRARPPLNKQEEDQVSSDWHFELPARRRDSHRSINNLSAK